MTDDQAAHLIHVLEAINDQLADARKHRVASEQAISNLFDHVQGNSVRLAKIEATLRRILRHDS